MAKGYWIALVEVKNQDGYKNSYVAGLPDVFKQIRRPLYHPWRQDRDGGRQNQKPRRHPRISEL